MNILFVCTGNTCRSPMAEGYLRHKNINGVNVLSRGIAADGSAVSNNSIAVMREVEIDISQHVSRQITMEDINNADKIICLSSSHMAALLSAGVKKEKLYVLADGISDPYGGDILVYRACRDEIFSAIDNLYNDGFFSEFKISSLEHRHVAEIAKLERLCFSEPWSEEGITEAFEYGTRFYIAESGNNILGYVGIKTVLDEGYITNVAVFPEHRRKGVASSLIKKVFSLAEENELSFVSLEVRKTNVAAIALYEKHGFKSEGIRPNFYSNPREDAIIMTRRFNGIYEDIKH